MLPLVFIKQICKNKKAFGHLVFVSSFAGPNEVERIEVLAGLVKVLAQDQKNSANHGLTRTTFIAKDWFPESFPEFGEESKGAPAEMVITVINIL